MHIFSFGHGYSARALRRRLPHVRWSATARTPESRKALEAEGIVAWDFDGTGALASGALDGVTHILASIPPDGDGDPVVRCCAEQIGDSGGLRWIGYLSTTGVYGDRQGGWVDERSALRPAGQRGARRVQAERDWLGLSGGIDGPVVQVFRLAGIYGPGRSQFNALRDGTSRRIVKPGQVFSRIHVEDIAAVLEASIQQPRDGGVYNVCDDMAAPPQDVVAFAAELLGVDPPAEVPFEAAEMSPMGRSFYSESKKVRNDLIKQELGVRLRYPTYREGLAAVLAAETASG